MRLRTALTYGLIAVLTIAARLPFLLRADRFFDSDEAVEGLMARHVLLGEHPLFLWGQRYKGVPEVYLTTAVFHISGPNVVALKAVTLACFVVFLCLNYRIVERRFSRTIATIATAFFIVGPPSLVLWTLSGSAEIVMTLLAGVVLLLAVDWWHRTSSPRALMLAGAALGFGLWVQSYILYYVVSLVVTAVIRPDWKELVLNPLGRLAPWLRGVVALLSGISALYLILGLIPFFVDGGVTVAVGGARIAVTNPQKMWWIAGAVFAAVFGIVMIAVRARQLVAPGLAFLAGYAPAIVGRIGNHGLGAPIGRMDLATFRAALPSVTQVMAPMLIGFRDPGGRPTISAVCVLILAGVVVASYWQVWRRRLTPFFHVFVIVAPAMFLVSGSYIDAQSYRYLMPMYAALPVVYALGVDAVRRASAAGGAVVLVVVLIVFAAQQASWYQKLQPDWESPAIIACLDRAGTRAARAGYWLSYKLTFLSNERIIVAPIDGMDRYPPYTELAHAGGAVDAAACR